MTDAAGGQQHGPIHGPRGSDPTQTDEWRNVVDPGTTWLVGTTYSAGDFVDDVAGIFRYEASTGSVNVGGTPTPNLGIEPGVTAGWRAFWNLHASIFQNGSNAGATGAIPNPVPQRYRLSVGPPNDMDQDGLIVSYTQHQIEIQGDVTGLVIGDTVFVIPPEYRHDYDVPYHTHDVYGAYVPCRLLSSGAFIWGTT